MLGTIEVTIEDIEFEVEYEVDKGEPQSFNSPGIDPSVEIIDIRFHNESFLFLIEDEPRREDEITQKIWEYLSDN